eukprot:TRINITY_DN46347_c0_g1_i1.p1 TRINITY_DN46347_c0_g1~~TRINITY_DN46347_c0_g1_i1.p1  ORF type:complete len:144 (-),score=20.52 TRINITY_DN46347_c0_g1_i1:144-575(-)
MGMHRAGIGDRGSFHANVGGPASQREKSPGCKCDSRVAAEEVPRMCCHGGAEDKYQDEENMGDFAKVGSDAGQRADGEATSASLGTIGSLDEAVKAFPVDPEGYDGEEEFLRGREELKRLVTATLEEYTPVLEKYKNDAKRSC